MNEKLQEALAEIITGAIESVSAAKGFILSEAPDVVRQLLAWEASICTFAVVMGFVAILAGVCLSCFFTRLRGKVGTSDAREGCLVGAIVAPIALCGAGSAVAITHAVYLIKVLVAPKLFLIEYASDLLK
jgi:hypothetical protein